MKNKLTYNKPNLKKRKLKVNLFFQKNPLIGNGGALLAYCCPACSCTGAC